MYDILIIGAGPAGLTAALYARRAEKSVLLLEKETFGGQITYSPKVENFPTVMQLSGNELAEKMLDQVLAHGAEVALGQATAIRRENDCFGVLTEDGEYLARSVILATGSHHRLLGIDREEEFIGNGISFCAVCDGAFYAGKTVAVIGGGNTALQEALMLSENCQKVFVVQNLPMLTGEAKLTRLLEQKDNVEIIYGTVVDELIGEGALRGILLRDTASGERSRLEIDGMFVAIGQVPDNDAFGDLIALDERGYVNADESCMTNCPGIFVAGDCRRKSVRQVTTACGDGAVAALAACRYLEGL